MKKELFFCMAVSLLALSSCSTSREGNDREEKASNETRLHAFEGEFDPSEYNEPLKTNLKKQTVHLTPPTEIPVGVSNPSPADLIQGFRVQIFASTNIDEASKQKSLAEELFPEEWFYLVYDPPTYKIRGGNFTTRFEADKLLRELKDQGFHDSWIVPDKILKDPPARQLPPMVPENNR